MKRDKYADMLHLMICTIRQHRRQYEKQLEPLGIHHTQHKMLMYLSDKEITPSQNELAGAFNVSPAAVAVTLNKMENGGYIRRGQSETDLRKNSILLTEKGKDTVRRSKDIFRSTDKRMFYGFDDSELAELAAMLERMKDNLTDKEQDSRI